jgi:hypothetical protein
MKFLILTSILLLSTGSFAQPVKHKKNSVSFSRPYGMAGCGLGSAALGKDGNQILAATTNGTFYSQLFGITSETLNCVDSDTNQVAHKSDVYIQFNKYALQGDIAQGQGETLAAYSQVIGCPSNVQLGSSLKGHFDQIFNQSNKTANEITDAIITVIKNNESLVKACQLG